MLNKQFSINKIGGGNFEKSELTKTRNVLTKGRLSLFVGAMIAALFVSFAYLNLLKYISDRFEQKFKELQGDEYADSEDEYTAGNF